MSPRAPLASQKPHPKSPKKPAKNEPKKAHSAAHPGKSGAAAKGAAPASNKEAAGRGKNLVGGTERQKPVPPEKERRLTDRKVVVRKGADPKQKPRNQVEQGLCRVIGCTAPATTNGYSRACYIKYWKQIKQKEQILSEGTLQRYIRELVEKYPEKTLLAVKHDLASDDAYAQMIRDLDLYGGIDELEHAQSPQNAMDDEEAENDIDSIKKVIDKEEDLF